VQLSGQRTFAIVELATKYGCYGYKRTTALLRSDGWHVNHKRVVRIWKREGLKVPMKAISWLHNNWLRHRGFVNLMRRPTDRIDPLTIIIMLFKSIHFRVLLGCSAQSPAAPAHSIAVTASYT